MDLLDENRSLIHTGKLRQLDTGFETFVLLFDNYCGPSAFLLQDAAHRAVAVVMTKIKEKEGSTKYHVNCRVGASIPNELIP